MALSDKDVRIPSGTSKIWKEECAFSYHTQESEGGILVDLNSWVGFSPTYAKLNFQQTGHTLYLNIIKTNTLKPKDESEKPKVLGIGVEGGFQVEDDKWEPVYQYEVVVLPSFERLPLDSPRLSDKVRTAAEAIIKADSAEKKEQVKQWVAEEGLLVSAVAENLVQLNTGRNLSFGNLTCDECGGDATTNLWLNLTDGHIGCGRKNFDGSGGQGHALDHYRKTNYPLVVKLGTITAEGADVFSYAEDNMVLDPLLEKHLAHWGLDMKSLTKTDKTVAELEIELQHTYDWSRAQENAASLVPVYGPGFTGIENLGNTCYMASILQVLFTVPEFCERYYGDREQIIQSCRFSEAPRDFHVQLSKLADALLSGNFSKPEPETKEETKTEYKKTALVRPFMLKSLVGEGHHEFSTNRQQDSLEFFQYFLQLVERKEHATGLNKDPSKVFKFSMEEKLKCSASNCVRYTTTANQVNVVLPIPVEKATNLLEVHRYRDAENLKSEEQKKRERESKTAPTPVYPKVSMEDCFKTWGQEEMIDDWFSPATQSKTIAIKQKRFQDFPKYLAIQLSRFVYEGNQLKKLEADVDVPDFLDLEHLRGNGLQPGEKEFPSQQEKPVKLDEDVIAVLTSMGFPRTRCEHAVYNNQGKDAQTAMDWLFARMDDPALDLPLQISTKKASDSSSGVSVDEGAVETLSQMGFSVQRCRIALQKTDNNPERALDWLFSHSEEPMEEVVKTPRASTDNARGKYRLFAFVTHMGKSTESGHYVAHIKKNDKWCIFNDRKVAESQNPPREMAYIYFFERI